VHGSKITEIAHIFGLPFIRSRGFALILTEMGWATFLAIFSQSHLVTLLPFRCPAWRPDQKRGRKSLVEHPMVLGCTENRPGRPDEFVKK
jgi:hypothetical protein